ncbi:probable aspartyl protease At4g16563 [Zingiber officinale]|uniref:probable aspartyl protease At4g16563 n=1 Tax=Zingiber officinale TaxID=94328 RepID=UPI001C4D52A2|nr:probable aspartyl protease At4g16563 [Zingiber officinale]
MQAFMAPLFLLLLLCDQLLVIDGARPDSVVFPLSHSLSRSQNSNFSTLQHLKSSALHSAARHRSRRHAPERRRQQVSLPLSPGSDYTLSVSVGAPSAPIIVSLYMDTGSDLVWFPCSPFECMLCEGKPSYPPLHPPLPPPPASRQVTCGSAACSAVHSGLPASDLCAIAACTLDDIETDSCSAPCPRFYYAYGDGSLVARLRRGPLSLHGSSAPSAAPLRLQNFTFACAHSALAEPVGVAGFGRGPLSLPAQLAALSPSLAARFSYCLVSHSFQQDRLLRPSPLILGRTEPKPSEPDQDPPFVYTPLLHNPKHPYFYSVGLESLSIGPSRVRAPPELRDVDRRGNGGMVVDSGTTFTMLPAETYTSLANEFNRQMSRAGFERAAEAEERTGLRPCYFFEDRVADRRSVPGLALHFAGNASVALPRRNYFMGFESGGRRVGCLMVMSGGEASGEEEYGGPAGTLGNFQQQGFEVVYDLEGKRVGFARRRCAALWEEMSRA